MGYPGIYTDEIMDLVQKVSLLSKNRGRTNGRKAQKALDETIEEYMSEIRCRLAEFDPSTASYHPEY